MDVNVENLDHAPRITSPYFKFSYGGYEVGTWYMVHGHHFMTPQPKSIIQNVVPLGQNWLKIVQDLG